LFDINYLQEVRALYAVSLIFFQEVVVNYSILPGQCIFAQTYRSFFW